LGEARFQVPLSAVDLGRDGAAQAVSCQKRAAGANAIAAHPTKVRCGNNLWHGTISCGLAVAPGFIPGASWPAPAPTAAGHKARRYNRLRSPEELARTGINGVRGGLGRPPRGTRRCHFESTL